ncbi:hypothetical protein B9Z19DRAFT_1125366 [Tuber borchii]|uniref:Uncharacterized protein n=1 Tax=Tuber borchii TaxID=42251 RepID=A0A2T6ZV81_TUBBO|nr:hypothetical protein B9Z19DRAFT_1125366 [Tuber borchii]
MNPFPDPHHLVALLYRKVGQYHQYTSRRQPINHNDIIGGIVDSIPGNELTFHALDALASICIADEERQVVAITFQIAHNESRIRLIVAENTDIGERLKLYLTDVWNKLKELSHVYARIRAVGGNNLGSENPRETPTLLKLPLAMRDKVVSDLFCDISRYTMKKNIKRARKWREGLAVFYNRLWLARSGVFEGLELNLKLAFLALEKAYTLLTNENLTRADWATASNVIELATQQVEIVVEDNVACENLAHELKSK